MTGRQSRPPSDLTQSRAKELRAKASEIEKLLWSALRGKNAAGLKFRRQHPIEPYIADFYCAAASLIIEVDGESHDNSVNYDHDRTINLQARGLEVIRVSNHDVLNNLEGVVEFIVRTALPRLKRTLP